MGFFSKLKIQCIFMFVFVNYQGIYMFTIFRQHAASIYGFVRYVCYVTYVCKKKCQATSKQGRRLRFGMLTVLTNIRSTKVLHHASCTMHHASSTMHHGPYIMHYASCMMHHASCIMHHASQATSKQGRRLRFGMLTDLTNIK